MTELDQIKDIDYFNTHLLSVYLSNDNRDLQKGYFYISNFFKYNYALSYIKLQETFALIRKHVNNDDAIINDPSDLDLLFSDSKLLPYVAYINFILIGNPLIGTINNGLTFKEFLEAVAMLANRYLSGYYNEDTTLEMLKEAYEDNKMNAMGEIGYKLRLRNKERLEQEHAELVERHRMDWQGGFFKNNSKRQQKRKNSRKSKLSRGTQRRQSRRSY